MKLNEIKTTASSTIDLREGVIPVHLTMTLDQVVSSGKITNNVQTFTMANLASMFKDGGPTRWPRDINSYGSNAGSDMIEAIRNLSNEDAVNMASWLLTELERPAAFESNPACAPQIDIVKWMMHILKHQD